MATEVEIKLRIPDPALIGVLWGNSEIRALMIEQPEDIPMSARYFDTPDHDLNAHHWALRSRREGDEMIVCFKSDCVTRGNLFTRQEYQCVSDDPVLGAEELVRQGAPEELLTLVRKHGLVERCRIEFLRRCARLRLPDGTEAELATDNGQILAGGKQEALCELECELLSGDPGSLLAWTNTLRYPLLPLSKYERALRLLNS